METKPTTKSAQFWMLGYRGTDVQMSQEAARANLGPDKFEELLREGRVTFCGYVVEIR